MFAFNIFLQNAEEVSIMLKRYGDRLGAAGIPRRQQWEMS